MTRSSGRAGAFTRRNFLSASGALLGTVALGAQARRTAAPPPAAVTPGQPGGRVIDIHHHFIPPSYVTAMGDSIVASAGVRSWTPQTSLETMDRYGVETAIVSISEGVEPADPNLTPKVSRESNEYGARLITDYPRRFGLFATLPLPNVDASLKELTYAMDTLHADGIGLNSHYGDGYYLGNPALDPVFAEMNRRKVVVFIHPKGTGVAIPASEGSRNIGTGELPFDTTRAIFNVLAQHTVEKFPDIRFIWPTRAARRSFSSAASRGHRPARLVNPGREFRATYARLSKIMSTFYYDLALTVSLSTMKAILEVAPASHLLLGSDIPYSGSRAAQSVRCLASSFTSV